MKKTVKKFIENSYAKKQYEKKLCNRTYLGHRHIFSMYKDLKFILVEKLFAKNQRGELTAKESETLFKEIESFERTLIKILLKNKHKKEL